jgi:hypothetical protein
MAEWGAFVFGPVTLQRGGSGDAIAEAEYIDEDEVLVSIALKTACETESQRQCTLVHSLSGKRPCG